MKNIRFDSAVTGIYSLSNLLAVATEDGTIFVINASSATIEKQISLPSGSGVPGRPLWSFDGDFIWIPSGDTAYYMKPVAAAKVESTKLESRIVSLFAHPDGISAFALMEDNSVMLLKPSGSSSQALPPQTDPIVSIVVYQKKVAVVSENQIQIFNSSTFELSKTITIPSRSATVLFAVASNEFGIVVIWADGHWARFTESLKDSGTCVTCDHVSFVGSHLCAACGESVKIFDLKFDAELQEITVKAKMAELFPDVVIAASENELHIREWSGLKKTTTRTLIGSAAPVQCKEVRLKLGSSERNLEQPVVEDVEIAKPEFKYKSVGQVIDNIINDRFVPAKCKEQVMKELSDPKYDDIREIAMLHLMTVVPFDVVMKYLEEGKCENVLVMMKKLEILNSEQIAEFIRRSLAIVDTNEVILAHFLTQPHDPRAADAAAALLSVDEVDRLFYFLARLVRSRRWWKELDVSLGTLDAAIKWSSRLITANFTALTLHHKTDGLTELKKELSEETERIEAAGRCWSIVENMTEEKQKPVPPSFMYIVERLDINLPE